MLSGTLAGAAFYLSNVQGPGGEVISVATFVVFYCYDEIVTSGKRVSKFRVYILLSY